MLAIHQLFSAHQIFVMYRMSDAVNV